MNFSTEYLLYINTSKDHSTKDYSPGGMVMPERSFSYENYRFGFQDQEMDNEIYGIGNLYAFKYRLDDPRLGRFWSVDPLASKYPWNSPYAFSENRLISSIELEGLEAIDLNTNKTDNTLSGENLKTYQKNKEFDPWNDLLSFKPAKSTFDAADKRVVGLNPQPIEEAYGDMLNLDYYSINITSLPKGFNTSDEFLSYVRTNFNQFTKGSGTSFGEFNSTEGGIFNSSNPLSSVMKFEVGNLDDLSVLTSKNQSNYWIFSPVFTLADLGHPVAGNRQFGLTSNDNGSYTFFTRGADRPWGGLDVMFSEDVFSGANKLWATVMNNVANYVNTNGGAATVNPNVVSKRISWSKDYKQK